LAQRTHQNFVEQIGLVLPTLLASGVFHPRLAAALGWAYFFGRLIYTLQYRKAGPKGRLFGAYTFFGTILGLAGLTIWAGIKLLRARKSN
jgi:glutathione S-transferase